MKKIINLVVIAFICNCLYAQNTANLVSENYELITFDYNSTLSDFAPTFYLEDLVFSSNRFGDGSKNIAVEGQEQPFYDLQCINKENNNVVSFSKRLNSKYHESTAVFTKDGKTVYFTRNNYTDRTLRADSTNINRLKLYKGTLNEKGKWIVQDLPFNNDEYSVAHPALSPDESILYFASDMPGSAGKSDIYKVDIVPNGFGQVVRLNNSINTTFRETFPFIDEIGNLYFSSDREGGLGNLDIYIAVAKADSFVVNRLVPPINSASDDMTFIIDSNGKGYFSSNRKGGIGEDDIYSFQKTTNNIEEESCLQSLTGIVVNMINNISVVNAKLTLYGETNNLLESVVSDSQGYYEFYTKLNCDSFYRILVEKEGFNEKKEDIKTNLVKELKLEIPLKAEPIIDIIYVDNGVKRFKINNLSFNLNKDDIRDDAAFELDKIISVMNEYPSIIIKIESHTDSRGSDLYNEKLSDRRAKSTRDYLVSRGISNSRIESAIGYGEKQLLNECTNGVKCSKEQHDKNRRSFFIITQI